MFFGLIAHNDLHLADIKIQLAIVGFIMVIQPVHMIFRKECHTATACGKAVGGNQIFSFQYNMGTETVFFKDFPFYLAGVLIGLVKNEFRIRKIRKIGWGRKQVMEGNMGLSHFIMSNQAAVRIIPSHNQKQIFISDSFIIDIDGKTWVIGDYKIAGTIFHQAHQFPGGTFADPYLG